MARRRGSRCHQFKVGYALRRRPDIGILDRIRNQAKRQSVESELDLGYFWQHPEKIDYMWTGGAPAVGTLFSARLEEFLGPARKARGAAERPSSRHRPVPHRPCTRDGRRPHAE